MLLLALASLVAMFMTTPNMIIWGIVILLLVVYLWKRASRKPTR